MADTIYLPLDVSRKEIRLLKLLPSALFDDPIRCTMETASLEDDLQYQALSWCWGTDIGRAVLQLNDVEVKCPKNLEAALRYFRDTLSPVTLWIDAICIRQDSTEEKSSQIPLMRDIYSQAQIVRIWLGVPADDSDEAIQLVNDALAGRNLFEKTDGKYLSKEQYQRLNALFERPWWTRTWVAQEFVLARRACFQCGYASFDPEGLEKWTERITRDIRTVKEDFWTHLNDSDIQAAEVVKAVEVAATFIDLANYLRQDSDSGSYNAVRTLCTTSGLQATDLRDKVFGTLGIIDPVCTDVWKRVPNWYSISVEFVYAATTFIIMNMNQQLYALCFIPKRNQTDMANLSKWAFDIENDNPSVESKERTKLLPSWSMDYSKASRKNESLNVWFDCTVKLDSWFMKMEYPFLKVQGIPFDEIVACHSIELDLKSVDRKWADVNTMRLLNQKWRTFFGIAYRNGTARQTYVGGGSMDAAYWRTAVGDMCLDEGFAGSRMPPATIKSYVKWLMDDSDESMVYASDWTDSGRGKAQLYDQSLRRWLQGGRTEPSNAYFFITRRGYIGLSSGRSATAVGDHVYLLAGSDVPFTLRLCTHPQETKIFSVVCECYIDGIMDGQAMRQSELAPSKQTRQNELRRRIFGGSPPDPLLPLTAWKEVTLI